jgi:hypothetical protein
MLMGESDDVLAIAVAFIGLTLQWFRFLIVLMQTPILTPMNVGRK